MSESKDMRLMCVIRERDEARAKHRQLLSAMIDVGDICGSTEIWGPDETVAGVRELMLRAERSEQRAAAWRVRANDLEKERDEACAERDALLKELGRW